MSKAVTAQGLLNGLKLKVTCNDVDVTPYLISGSLSWALDEIARTMSLEFGVTESGAFPSLAAHSNIKVKLSGNLLFDGWVEQVSLAPTRSGYRYRIEGRSKACDFVDTTLGTSIEVKGKRTLGAIIQLVSPMLKPLGLRIETAEDLGSIVSLDDEQFNGTPTTTVFDFLDKVARRFNLLLTSKADNTLLLTRVTSEDNPKYFCTIDPSNVKASHPLLMDVTLAVDMSQRYHTYRVHSKNNSPTRAQRVTKSTVHSTATSTDAEVRETRILDLELETATTDARVLKQRADWERNVRRGRSITYSGTLAGFIDPTSLLHYDVNGLISVSDTLTFINSTLLIKKIDISFSREEGIKTHLDMAPIETFLPEPLPNRAPSVKGKKKKGRRRNSSDKDTLLHPAIQANQTSSVLLDD
jgi:prophage tail gpP-like protein